MRIDNNNYSNYKILQLNPYRLEIQMENKIEKSFSRICITFQRNVILNLILLLKKCVKYGGVIWRVGNFVYCLNKNDVPDIFTVLRGKRSF